MKHRLNNLSLQSKYLLIVWGSILSVSLVCFAMVQVLTGSLNQMIYQEVRSNLSFTGNQVERELREIDSFSDMIRTNGDIQKNLDGMRTSTSMNYSSAYRNVYETLQRYAFSTAYVQAVAIVQESTVITPTRTPELSMALSHIEEIQGLAQEAAGGTIWYSFEDDGGSFVVNARSVLKISNLELDNLGTLLILVDMDSMLNAVKPSVDTERQLLLFQNHHCVAGRGDLSPSAVDAMQRSEAPWEIMKIDGTRQFVVSEMLQLRGWQYTCCIDYDRAFRATRFAGFSLMAAMIATVLIAGALSTILVRSIHRHFKLLTDKIDYFQEHKLELLDVDYDYSQRNDELGKIHQNFDDMANTIHTLVEENYVKQMKLQEGRIKELQQQIDPHFLYNTLDTISWSAKAYGITEISSMVDSLGKLFRASVSEEGNTVTLRKEKELIRYYTDILRYRFGDRLEIVTEIDESMMDCLVPRFCLQPLVENAAKYALDGLDETCVIRVSGIRNETSMELKVQNSGSLFETCSIEELNSQRKRGSGIGLRNLDDRIKLLFGSQWGLELSNQKGMATVLVRLPCRKDNLEGDGSGDTADHC